MGFAWGSARAISWSVRWGFQLGISWSVRWGFAGLQADYFNLRAGGLSAAGIYIPQEWDFSPKLGILTPGKWG